MKNGVFEFPISYKVSEVICLGCKTRWIACRPEVLFLKKIQCPFCEKLGLVIETGEIVEKEK